MKRTPPPTPQHDRHPPTLDIDIHLPLDRFDLELTFQSDHDCIGLFGKSGCGKTSFLETLCGLRPEATGCVRFRNTVWQDSGQGVRVPPEKRGIGYLPQRHLLFPHWSVRDNLMAGRHRPSRRGVNQHNLLDEVVEALEIQTLLERRVAGLSGGESQRVALGRALCSNPDLLLLDEPLASLDRPLRTRILPYFLRAREQFQLPMIVVSHDPFELQALCDEIVAMENGACIRKGSPAEVFTDARIHASLAG